MIPVNSSAFFPPLTRDPPFLFGPARRYSCSVSLSVWIVSQLGGESSVEVRRSGDSTVALSCLYPALPLSPRETELQVCVAWHNHSRHLSPSSASSFLSVSLTFPHLFLCSTNQRLCLEGNQAALANYAALAAAPSSSPSSSSCLCAT